MRNYIILNGVNSNTITGLLISTLPPITKPKMRTQTEEIDGRDGDIVTKLGYSAYEKSIQIGLYGDFDIDEVIAYFNTEGTVIFSNEPDKYYNYQILDQIDYEKLIRFKTANVKMHVQPFKYPLEETPVEITIQNVTGSGEAVDINNTAEAPMTIALKGNTSQDGTPTPDAPVEVKTVTGGQEIKVVGKNILPQNKYIATQTTNGITYTNNEDGTFNLTGTATANTTIQILPIGSIELMANQSYYLYSSVPYNGTTFNMSIAMTDNGSSKFVLANGTYTPTATPTNVRLQFYIASGQSINQTNIKIMLVKGSTAPTTYEPYQSQSYEINLGKNLFDKDNSNQIIDAYINPTGWKLQASTGLKTLYINCEPNTTYTVSKILSARFLVGTSDSIETGTIMNKHSFSYEDTKLTITSGVNDKYLLVFYYHNTQDTLPEAQIRNSIQIEKGNIATSYAPYKEPVELCKIGDYQDSIHKNGNKWYLEKNIGKVVLDGNTTLTSYATNVSGHYRYGVNISDIKKSSSATEVPSIYCTHYVGQVVGTAGSWGGHQGISIDNSNERIYINDDTYYTQDTTSYKTWLSTNNVDVYYPLATPTTTEITDTELIGQLEAIKTARSYDTTTHISQNTANKPFILNATAVQKGTDTGIVDNEGNIYSKPTIDIEGSGIADIYLNRNQIFSIDLSTINECVIDTTNLEAYNPTTNILMNRQVTGDYSNFKLNAGDNEVKISGVVTKATISNYTRWL